jgi:hypothetical protein
MTLNLLPLPYTLAINIIHWCQEHNIDSEKCTTIRNAMSTAGYQLKDEDWILDIPDKYISWFMLKWDFLVNEDIDEL